LASTSSELAALLRSAGIEFDMMSSEMDETIDSEETPDGYVRRVAQQKAEAVAPLVPGRVILGADTAVVVDNQVLAGPADEEAARRMLRQLSGREHLAITAVCLIDLRAESKRTQTIVTRTRVELAPLSDEEIDWYVTSGEPLGKAGGYAMQGLASRFVTRIDGSWSNVVGLPVSVVYSLCKQSGLLSSDVV
jgi:septum formation protein